ncbi:hypothetical protein SO802_006649 [Lithocarpus litseifolius]|uniref:Thaumatin-like protein n=1 Tax=Lithocarpus litseifolius TaxID=425828 RepID=A0AAW2DS65_9ROSI
MSIFKNLSISFFFFATLFITFAHAARFNRTNNCPYVVWAAAVPSGGRQLNSKESWPFDVNAGTIGGRVWARTGCVFDGSGHGSCQTGDCGGLLQCQAYGAPLNTLAKFALNQYLNLDFYDISLVDGFNAPMNFIPTSNGCTKGITCTADISGQCPAELNSPSGYCNNPCTVFKIDEYCCNSGNCGPTTFSEFFKNLCPDAYSYPKDDATSTFTCNGGTNYNVVFCLSSSSFLSYNMHITSS